MSHQVDQDKFIVKCLEVPSRRVWYYLKFDYNTQLIERIKSIEPKNDRKFDGVLKVWALKYDKLYWLINSYKGSDLIHFSFDEKTRDKFVAQVSKHVEKIRKAEEEKRKVEEQKIRSLKLKEEFESNVEKYRPYAERGLKEGIKLYDHQVVSVMFLQQAKASMLSLDMGLGKAQNIDSKLLTPNGYIRMGDIKVGDEVIGSNGKPTTVTGVYPQGEKDIYEITFNDNTTVECCDEHLWPVNTPTRNKRNHPYQIKTLREIIDEGLTYNNGNRKHYIPIVKPIEFENRNLLIDPYILGVILGDGSITQPYGVKITSPDHQIIDEIQSRLPSNQDIRKIENTDIKYIISSYNKRNYVNKWLKYYKLKGRNSHTKFIPNEYKYSSISQRLELLQGILDTNGTISKDRMNIDLTLGSKQLIEDVMFIVQSVGGIARYEKIDKKPTYYRLSIKLPPEFIPFKLKKKLDRFVSPTKYLPNRAIKDIKYVGKREAQCISVDAEDHLYCTDNCILTHNTISSISWVEMNKSFQKVFVITPNSLKFNYYNEVHKFTDSKAHIINWKKNKYTISESKYIIVNYEFFNPKDFDKVKKKMLNLNIKAIDCLILDESHRIKNKKANTTKNITKIFNNKFFRRGERHLTLMSGTPAPNRVKELFTQLNFVSPVAFPNQDVFYTMYCGLTKEGFGWTGEPSNEQLRNLYDNISPFIYRKRKHEVLDLPEKIISNINLEFTDREEEEYKKLEQGVVSEILELESDDKVIVHFLTILLRLRQFTSMCKINAVKEFIDSVMESGEQLFVVDEFKRGIIKLHEQYKDISALYTGGMNEEVKNTIVENFQDANHNLKLLFATIGSANYGLTLTKASKIVIISQPWTVGQFDQVIDRLHRISQEKTVNAYNFIYPNTIDEDIYYTLESKRRELSMGLDNEEYENNMKISVINDVIQKIKQRNN